MKKSLVLLFFVEAVLIFSARAQFDGEYAVFVVANSDSPNGSETAVQERLTGMGLDVAMIAEAQINDAEAGGADLLLISGTVNSGTAFTNMPGLASYELPVINWEPALYDEMGFSAEGGAGMDGVEGKIKIADPDHPMAASLDGEVVVVSSLDRRFCYGRPGGDVNIVALSFDNDSNALIFCYEEGAAMYSGNAPARRVGYYLLNEVAEFLTDEGWALFDAAVQWAMGLLPDETFVFNNKSQDIELSVYPNPSSGGFELSFVSDYFQTAEIHIRNATGQEVMQRVFHVRAGSNQFRLDASGLKEGFYFYSVHLDNKVTGGKLIISE